MVMKLDNKKTQKVLRSIETDLGDRCVDIFIRPDKTFGFEEFRRDSEDMGTWTRVGGGSNLSFESEGEAIKEAKIQISWFKPQSKDRS